MHARSYEYLQEHPELANFVRYNPRWYRYLSRGPDHIIEMEKEAKKFYGRTWSQRLEKMNNRMQMIGMLMKFAEDMKD